MREKGEDKRRSASGGGSWKKESYPERGAARVYPGALYLGWVRGRRVRLFWTFLECFFWGNEKTIFAEERSRGGNSKV